MSMGTEAEQALQAVGLQDLRKNWGWILALGILLVVLGSVAIGRAWLVTLASMVFFGWLMIIGGALQTVHSFWQQRGWSGFFLDLATGLLYLVVGFLVVTNPAETGITLTLLIALFLVFGGIFRIVAAISVRYPHWGWVLLHGVVQLVLGLLIWRQWPVSGLWVIGLFIGIEMIFNGWALVMLSTAVKSLPAGPSAGASEPATT